MNERFPLNAIRPMRLILVADREGKAREVAQALFHSMWAENCDIAADGELTRAAESAGLDPVRALSAIEEPTIKDALRSNTDEALRRGAFGAPTIFVDDQLFWGNDRLHFVEAALAG
jgi:2-hydroxychromene-2-carboxylate isomerase